MKKIFASVLAATLMATMSVAASAADFDASSALNNAIAVDAVKDAAYVNDGIVIDVPEATEGGATGVAYAAWDNDNLYLYVEVTDEAVTAEADVTSIWANDSIEVYFNLEGADGNITDINAAQYTVGPSYTAWAGGGLHRDNNMDAAKYAYEYTDFGYIIEVSIPWGADYAAEANAVVPFAIGINDDADADASTREFHNFTGAAQGNLWSVADASYDALTLTTDEYVEPEPETVAEVVEEAVAAPQTFDAGVIAAVAAVVSAAGYALSKKR